jgi:hypothetical protein
VVSPDWFFLDMIFEVIGHHVLVAATMEVKDGREWGKSHQSG